MSLLVNETCPLFLSVCSASSQTGLEPGTQTSPLRHKVTSERSISCCDLRWKLRLPVEVRPDLQGRTKRMKQEVHRFSLRLLLKYRLSFFVQTFKLFTTMLLSFHFFMAQTATRNKNLSSLCICVYSSVSVSRLTTGLSLLIPRL